MSDDTAAPLRDALRLIAAFAGKTLITASGWPNEQAAYSAGAGRAFNQCAEIAQDALARGETNG